MEKLESLSGELLVVGCDCVEIELPKFPKHTTVSFKHLHDGHHHPCNPHHDRLWWEVSTRHHKVILIINWEVANSREIVWTVKF